MLRNLGVVYLLLNKGDAAMRYYARALQVAREIGDLALEGKVLRNMGAVYLRVKQPLKAIKSYEQALRFARG